MPRTFALRFQSHGVNVAVTSDDPAIFDAAAPQLPPLRTPLGRGRAHRAFHLSSTRQPDGKKMFWLHAAGRTLASARNVERVIDALEWEVNLLLAERARDRIFVHAGVVEWQGKALLIPGRSHSGKSTLVAELVKAGCAYLSDEYAILDSRGACHAYPRPLSLRAAGRRETRAVEDLGGRVRHGPLPVGLIVVTRYQRGASWQPSRLSAGEAVMALLENTVAARSRSREALVALGAAAKDTEALGGTRGEAADLVQALGRHVRKAGNGTTSPNQLA